MTDSFNYLKQRLSKYFTESFGNTSYGENINEENLLEEIIKEIQSSSINDDSYLAVLVRGEWDRFIPKLNISSYIFKDNLIINNKNDLFTYLRIIDNYKTDNEILNKLIEYYKDDIKDINIRNNVSNYLSVRVSDDKYFVMSGKTNLCLEDTSKNKSWKLWFLNSHPANNIICYDKLYRFTDKELNEFDGSALKDRPIICYFNKINVDDSVIINLLITWQHISYLFTAPCSKELEEILDLSHPGLILKELESYFYYKMPGASNLNYFDINSKGIHFDIINNSYKFIIESNNKKNISGDVISSLRDPNSEPSWIMWVSKVENSELLMISSAVLWADGNITMFVSCGDLSSEFNFKTTKSKDVASIIFRAASKPELLFKNLKAISA